jgi:acyl-CoA reductase-like NAD-dependent aldehyde dehydrogenase
MSDSHQSKATVPRLPLWIDGREASPAAGAYFEDNNPLDDSPYRLAARADESDVRRAVTAAHDAFQRYRKTVVKDREKWLSRAAQLLEEQAAAFVEILIDEIGSPITKARFEVAQAVAILRAAAGSTRQVSGKTLPSDTPGRFSMSVRYPVGVVASITPFNVPLSKGIRQTASALAMGNTVVLLPSEEAPQIAIRLAQLYAEAGIPDGAFNVLTGHGHEIGDALTTDQRVRVVTFTGSNVVGQHIGNLCSANGKRFTLELGGKNPLVVMDSADVQRAVEGVVTSAFTFQGQICMGASRVYVQRSLFDDFAERLIEASGALGAGDLRDPSTNIGPLVNKKQRQRVRGHIDDAMEKGATRLCGGDWEGHRCPPTVFTNVTPDMTIYHEETFGPVLSLYPIDSLDEAIAYANDSRYGLSASIYTKDLTDAMRFAEEVQAGMVHVNAPTIYAEPHVPFGGVGESGFGREGTEVDIELMTEWKWVTIQE